MSNPHLTDAAGYLEVARAVLRTSQQTPAPLLADFAQTEALLAIAHELHTANLIALGDQPTELGDYTAATYRQAAIERMK